MMRTTLTLEPDVAAELDRLHRTRQTTFKELVNEVLRRGLREIGSPVRRRKSFHTESTDLGRLLIAGIDNVSETLAIAEGEGFR